MKPNHKAGMELETIDEQLKALTLVQAAQVRVKMDFELPEDTAKSFTGLVDLIRPSIEDNRKRLQLDSEQKAALLAAAKIATTNTVYAAGVVDSYGAIHGIPPEEALEQMSTSDNPLFISAAVVSSIGDHVIDFSKLVEVAA